MPVITSLKPQKNKRFVNVSVDGKFRFGIDLDNLYKYGLKIEKEFTEEELEEINREANFNKTFNKILNFAMRRPHSESELVSWLSRKKVDKEFNEKLLKKLANLELLDDEKFTKWWVEQRTHFKHKSKRELQFELRQKGVNSKLIDKVLGESDLDEFDMAQKQAEKKLRSLGRFDDQTRKKKLGEFLQRKGFGWEIVKKVLDDKNIE
jgi:regulatory protein